jgi:hypothetical protein
MATSCILVRCVGMAGTNQAKLEAVRVNWDGYPEHMLENLQDNWSDAAVVPELFGAGEISSLGENWEDTVLFNNSQKFVSDCMASLKKQAYVDYVYYYDSALGCWV